MDVPNGIVAPLLIKKFSILLVRSKTKFKKEGMENKSEDGSLFLLIILW